MASVAHVHPCVNTCLCILVGTLAVKLTGLPSTLRVYVFSPYIHICVPLYIGIKIMVFLRGGSGPPGYPCGCIWRLHLPMAFTIAYGVYTCIGRLHLPVYVYTCTDAFTLTQMRLHLHIKTRSIGHRYCYERGGCRGVSPASERSEEPLHMCSHLPTRVCICTDAFTLT